MSRYVLKNVMGEYPREFDFCIVDSERATNCTAPDGSFGIAEVAYCIHKESAELLMQLLNTGSPMQ